MRRERSFDLTFPVLARQKLTVVLTGDMESSWGKHLPEEKWSGEGDEAGLYWTDDKGTHFIFLPWTASAGTVAHESYHAVHEMFTFVDAKPDDETIAYHLGFIVDHITEQKRGKRTVRKNETKSTVEGSQAERTPRASRSPRARTHQDHR